MVVPTWIVRGPAPFTFAVTGQMVLGRSPDVDLVVSAPSVSRRHAALSAESDGLSLRALSARSGTFVNGERLEPDQSVRLTDGDRVQFGSVVCVVEKLESTVPVLEPHDDAWSPRRGDALIRVRRGADLDAVYVGGRLLDLPAAVGRAFTVLAVQVSDVVSTDELAFEVGPEANLHQIVSLIRRELRDSVDRGDTTVGEWAELVHAAAIGRRMAFDEADVGAVMRRVVLSKRNEGYVLCLPPSAVSIELDCQTSQ